MSIKIIDDDGHKLIVPSTLSCLNQISSKWFLPNFWAKENKIVGESQGRKTAWFIEPKNTNPNNDCKNHWVLRHYYRGGLIAKITNDKFFYTGLKRTRAYLEVQLLLNMIELDLPVPKPIAAKITRKGLFYQSDLLMQKIDAPDLVSYLRKHSLSSEQWQEIGRTISKFHSHGIYHSDLNSHNILIRIDKTASIGVFVIDFDRCEKRVVKSKTSDEREHSWQKNNLSRLYRSLVKEKQISPELNFSEANWLEMINGYSYVNGN